MQTLAQTACGAISPSSKTRAIKINAISGFSLENPLILLYYVTHNYYARHNTAHISMSNIGIISDILPHLRKNGRYEPSRASILLYTSNIAYFV